MASMNKVILLGNVGKDPEIRTFDNGGKVANFSLATTEKWKDKNTGEAKSDTQWHNISASGPVVKVIEQYVKKGMSILVEGKLKQRSWEHNGEKKYITEVKVDSLTLVGNKNREVDPADRFNSPEPVNAVPVEEDDLPF